MQSREEIYHAIVRILVDEFDIAEGDISQEANLYEELDLDSIDAVDLVAKIQELTGKKVRPDQFRSVRTVGDVVGAIESLVTG